MKAIACVMAATLATAMFSVASLAQEKSVKDLFKDDLFKKKNSELLVGKWSPEDAKSKDVVLEFTKTGELKITVSADGISVPISGKYKMIDENTVEISMSNPEKKDDVKTTKLTIKSITMDEAVIVAPDGKEEKLKAVK